MSLPVSLLNNVRQNQLVHLCIPIPRMVPSKEQKLTTHALKLLEVGKVQILSRHVCVSGLGPEPSLRYNHDCAHSAFLVPTT